MFCGALPISTLYTVFTPCYNRTTTRTGFGIHTNGETSIIASSNKVNSSESI